MTHKEKNVLLESMERRIKHLESQNSALLDVCLTMQNDMVISIH